MEEIRYNVGYLLVFYGYRKGGKAFNATLERCCEIAAKKMTKPEQELFASKAAFWIIYLLNQ